MYEIKKIINITKIKKKVEKLLYYFIKIIITHIITSVNQHISCNIQLYNIIIKQK